MPFTHLVFLFVFLPLCLAGYYGIELIGWKWKTLQTLRMKDLFLWIASLGFYACAGIRDAFFLVGYSILVYAAGRLIAARKQNPSP